MGMRREVHSCWSGEAGSGEEELQIVAGREISWIQIFSGCLLGFLALWPSSRPWFLRVSIFLPVLRDLTELKAEHARLSGSLLTCCLRLTVRAQSRESTGSGRAEESEPAQLLLLVAKTQALEKEAHEKSQELIQLRSQGDLEKAELQDR